MAMSLCIIHDILYSILVVRMLNKDKMIHHAHHALYETQRVFFLVLFTHLNFLFSLSNTRIYKVFWKLFYNQKGDDSMKKIN